MTQPKRQPYKIDTDFGLELHGLISAEAEAAGRQRSEVVRELVRDGLLARSVMRDQVRTAVLAVAAATEPDERYDPADDPRMDEALNQLARLLGSVYAAAGIADALNQLWVQRELGVDAGE